MKKLYKVLPLLLVASLTACAKTEIKPLTKHCYYFYTELDISVYTENEKVIGDIEKICRTIDAVADATQDRGTIGIYQLNNTNDKIEIAKDLYDLLDATKKAQESAPNFNPLVGSLSEKWKIALDKGEVLSDSVIQEELNKINNSSLNIFKEDSHYFAQRTGDAIIDLGAITKGYALDQIYAYLSSKNITDYLINAGSSSILLGKNSNGSIKVTQDDGEVVGVFTVALRDVPGYTFMANDCVVSSSGNDIQGVKINNVMYSHIINPNTGSAVMENDAVIVETELGKGALGDALSTSLMMNTIDEIEELEEALGFRAIVIKDNQVVYKNAVFNS